MRRKRAREEPVQPIVSIENLGKTYASGFEALKNISLEIRRGETFGYLGEALLYVERAKRTGLPVMVTMSFETLPAQAYEGVGPAECARRLEAAGADIVGVNCLSGPDQQLPVAVEMREAVDCFVASQPAAYRTSDQQPDFTAISAFPQALDPLQLARAEMGRFAGQAHAAGISYIGSCCGSVQIHVRAMAQALGKLSTEERQWRSAGKPMSAYEQHHHDALPRRAHGQRRASTDPALCSS